MNVIMCLCIYGRLTAVLLCINRPKHVGTQVIRVEAKHKMSPAPRQQAIKAYRESEELRLLLNSGWMGP
jgi:hypothetical protein